MFKTHTCLFATVVAISSTLMILVQTQYAVPSLEAAQLTQIPASAQSAHSPVDLAIPVNSENAALAQSPHPETAAQAGQTKTESRLTLGVHVAKLGNALGAHLGLPSRVGLLVEHVVAGSAADDIGIKKHDVLHKLDGQLLVNREQLEVLLGTIESVKAVEITLIHEGESLDLSAVLKPKMVVAGRAFDAFRYFHGGEGFSHKGFQNCSVCHAGSADAILNDSTYDNYEFFHGKTGPKEFQDCSSCHMRNVLPLDIKKAT